MMESDLIGRMSISASSEMFCTKVGSFMSEVKPPGRIRSSSALVYWPEAKSSIIVAKTGTSAGCCRRSPKIRVELPYISLVGLDLSLLANLVESISLSTTRGSACGGRGGGSEREGCSDLSLLMTFCVGNATFRLLGSS